MRLDFFTLLPIFPIWVWFVLGLAIILVIAGAILEYLNRREEVLPYLKRAHLLTQSEHRLFIFLNEAFGQQYYIFPQVHIASIIRVKNGERDWQKYFNKIIRKSVDFVIFDKENISPLLVVELDDATHEREDRKIRDVFVDSAFKAAEIPIIHVKTAELNNLEQIKLNITQLLQQPISTGEPL